MLRVVKLHIFPCRMRIHLHFVVGVTQWICIHASTVDYRRTGIPLARVLVLHLSDKDIKPQLCRKIKKTIT